MRLLIVTQVVDVTDPYLGFFHSWLLEFARRFERIEVICLREGKHSLPENVQVHSLGKEQGVSRLTYLLRLMRYAWQLRRGYDAVFVHMNQEYVLLLGWLWKSLRKRIYLWRNHYEGGVITDIAAQFATKVFCTSRFSYTAKYTKTTLMPIGVDTDTFRAQPGVVRVPRPILFFGRFAPAKRPHVLLEALGILASEGVSFRASFYGSALPKHATYRREVVQCAGKFGLSEVVTFFEGVPHAEAPAIFSAHEIFVNLSSSGMYDKTIFEAAACGALVLSSSRDVAALSGDGFVLSDPEDASGLADKLRTTLALPEEERSRLASQMRADLLRGQDLRALGERLFAEVQ